MGLCHEACRDDGVECDVTSIMLKALRAPPYAQRFCVVGVCRGEMSPDCAPEEVIEEGDSRK